MPSVTGVRTNSPGWSWACGIAGTMTRSCVIQSRDCSSTPAKLHVLGHRGEFFKVQGPLNVPRPPQGHPVLVQAGASDDGKEFAAEFAEIIFTNHLSVASGQAYCRDLRARIARHGRAPDQVKVLPGLSPVVAATKAEAEAKYAHLQSLIDPVVGREMLSTVLGGIDLAPYDLDGPLPDLEPPRNVIQSAFDNWTQLARDENLTIRELSQSGRSSSHGAMSCRPSTICGMCRKELVAGKNFRFGGMSQTTCRMVSSYAGSA